MKVQFTSYTNNSYTKEQNNFKKIQIKFTGDLENLSEELKNTDKSRIDEIKKNAEAGKNVTEEELADLFIALIKKLDIKEQINKVIRRN